MSCDIEEKNGKIEVVMTFGRDDLIYDIANCAWLEGHMLADDTPARIRQMIQDADERGNIDRITRVIDLKIAECREMLYPYVRHAIHKPVLDNRLKETAAYGIICQMPASCSQTTVTLLERLIHEYLVCCGMAEWMSLTNPERQAAWLMKAAEAEHGIQTCMNTRMGRVRRRMHPF